MTPDLSIIIVSYNSEKFIEKCLRSVVSAARGINAEIWVVDNASTDSSLEILDRWRAQINLIRNSVNGGFSKAINQGIKAASGRYCLWLNPDSEILEGNLAGMIAYFEAHPAAGIAGLQILNPDRSLQLSSRAFPSYQTALFNRYSLLTRLFPNNPISKKYLQTDRAHEEIRQTDWVSGAALFHRRDLALKLGGLDENFFMYCEDVDFCLRAHREGFKIIYDPGVKVLHHIGGSSRSKPYAMIVQRHRSMWVYYRKHYRAFFLKDFAVGAVILTRCFFLLIIEKTCRYIRAK